MAIGDAIETFRKQSGMTQREIADKLHFDRSMISKIESGERQWPEAHDAKLARMNWRFALQLADERTGGWVSNILEDLPNLDLHPAALKDLLMKEMHEAQTALEALVMAKHIDPAKRRESAEKVWQELKDVEEKAAVLRGVLEEEFALDRDRMIKKHAMEIKEGER